MLQGCPEPLGLKPRPDGKLQHSGALVRPYREIVLVERKFVLQAGYHVLVLKKQDCAVPGRKSADHVLVTGHWSALGLRIEPNLLALDSGCLWGRHLTAVRLPGREVFQIDCSGEDVT